MRKQQRFVEYSSAKPVLRRDALKSLGAFAISCPALVAAACSVSDTSSVAESSDAAGTGDHASAAGSSRAAAGTTGTAPAQAKAPSSGAAGSGFRTQSASAGVGASAPADGSGSAGRAGSNQSAGHSATTNTGSAGSAAEHAAAAGSNAGTGAAVSGGSSAPPPIFDDAASCTLTTTDIEGPFFIDDHEFPDDESLIRSDIRESMTGVEFQLSFRVLDAKKACAPIEGAELYIWHCNADGLYSGFDGQDPAKPYMGSSNPTPMNKDRFCRGVQLTDSSGIASFTTVYPGWYAGRPIHIHLMGRFDGMTARLITTQLYFAAAFTREVHSSEPAYMARAATIPDGSANPPSGKPAMPTMKHTPGLVVGTLNVIVNRA